MTLFAFKSKTLYSKGQVTKNNSFVVLFAFSFFVSSQLFSFPFFYVRSHTSLYYQCYTQAGTCPTTTDSAAREEGSQTRVTITIYSFTSTQLGSLTGSKSLLEELSQVVDTVQLPGAQSALSTQLREWRLHGGTRRGITISVYIVAKIVKD